MAYESDAVAAMQWVFDNQDQYNIRVVNLSINSTVAAVLPHQPPRCGGRDPLVQRHRGGGSAGNTTPGSGSSPVQAAPANDPFVITVGASYEQGTADRLDDTMALLLGRRYRRWTATPNPKSWRPAPTSSACWRRDSPWEQAYPERVVHERQILPPERHLHVGAHGHRRRGPALAG